MAIDLGRSLRACVIVTASAIIAGAAAGGGLSIGFAVDGTEPQVIEPAGTSGARPNFFQYFGSTFVAGDGISWQLTVEGAAGIPTTPRLVGQVSVSNFSSVPRHYVITLTQPALTACPWDNVAGGSAFATLLVDTSGGYVKGPRSGAAWSALVDGVVIQELFADLELESEGFGTLLAGPESFGDPVPSQPTLGVTESIGLRYEFTLSAGETFSISSFFLVAFVDLDCIVPGDLDGDGIVDGSDLGILLALWGSDDPFADLNGDGIVDGADLGLLLSYWTGR